LKTDQTQIKSEKKEKIIRGGCRRNGGEENRREGMKRGKRLKKTALE
jgi:hypothetical protein